MDEIVNSEEEGVASAGIEPVSESSVLFRGNELRTAILADKQRYVSVNSVCEAFGLVARAQRKRMNNNSYWLQYSAMIMMDTLKGKRPTLCIASAALPMFMTGVEVDRVKNLESRELIEAFLDEAMDVLAEHYDISEKSDMLFWRGAVARLIAEHDEGKVP